jgi:hypothetical protein
VELLNVRSEGYLKQQLDFYEVVIITYYIIFCKKLKQSGYRPGVAQRVPGN